MNNSFAKGFGQFIILGIMLAIVVGGGIITGILSLFGAPVWLQVTFGALPGAIIVSYIVYRKVCVRFIERMRGHK